MKPSATFLLCCAIALAACSKDPYEPEKAAQQAPAAATPAAPPPAPAPSAPPADTAPADTVPADTAPPAIASATGKVDAVDTTAGVITIAHDPVDVLGWPAMTMGFKATPEQIAAVQVGDNVRFEFDTKGNEATIVSIASSDE